MHNRKKRQHDNISQTQITDSVLELKELDDSPKKIKRNAEVDEVLTFMDLRELSFQQKFKQEKVKIAEQIEAFYADSYSVPKTAKEREYVEKCISVYCQSASLEAGVMLNRHIENVAKSEISQMMIKAGANLNAKVEFRSDSFTRALSCPAPDAALIKLLFEHALAEFNNSLDQVPKVKKSYEELEEFNLSLISKFYDKNFMITDDNRHIVLQCIRKACAKAPYQMGIILNENIRNTEKAELSQWIMEAGAYLLGTSRQQRNPDYYHSDNIFIVRYSTFYYALIAKLPLRIYELFHQAGVTNPDTDYRLLTAPMVAFLCENDEAYAFYSKLLPTEARDIAYALKQFDYEHLHLDCTLKVGTQKQFRLKLWRNSDEKLRLDTLDHAIMSAAFSSLTTVEACLQQYEEFEKYAPIKPSTPRFFCKRCQIYSTNSIYLLEIASAQLCAVVIGQEDRSKMCEKLLKHRIFSIGHSRHGFDPDERIQALIKMRDYKKSEQESAPKTAVPTWRSMSLSSS